jgi:hypothetical protein
MLRSVNISTFMRCTIEKTFRFRVLYVTKYAFVDRNISSCCNYLRFRIDVRAMLMVTQNVIQ